MVECYELPTAKPYITTGMYYTFVGGVKQTGVTLNNIVLYETIEMVGNGFVGIIRKVQISTSILVDKPENNAQLIVGDSIYNFKNPVKRQNPLYVAFWESEVKAI